jgi:secondary thiamine-phosphate synthase enzyme
MSRSSAVTAREHPIGEVTDVVAGSFAVHGENIVVHTERRVELVDLTERIMEAVRRAGIREGLGNLWSMHTTCAVFVNEFQEALVADIERFLGDVVGQDRHWMHNDPLHSDCDRMNAESHLRAMLLGQSLGLQISGGEAVVGQWQRILMAELDGPRERTLRLQVCGIRSEG